MNKNLKVLYVIKYMGKTVGIEVCDIETNKVFRVEARDFLGYKDRFQNAIITVDNIVRGKGCSLPVKNMTNGHDLIDFQKEAHKKYKYMIMYEDYPVIAIYDSSIEVHNERYLPFMFKGIRPLTKELVMEWIKDRFNMEILNMGKLCKARRIDKTIDDLIYDSFGASVLDHFWIRQTNTSLTWRDLQENIDLNEDFAKLVLTGRPGKKTGEVWEGYTTLWTLPGINPKIVRNGYLCKKKDYVSAEVPAKLVADALMIDMADIVEERDYVNFKLFTKNSLCLVLERELRKAYNIKEGCAVLELIRKWKRPDLFKQFQRLIIFNYLVGNTHLTGDNFGFLYLSTEKEFKVHEVAPAFGLSHAFASYEPFTGYSGDVRDRGHMLPIEEWAGEFILDNFDIIDNFKRIDMKKLSRHLSEIQIKAFKGRMYRLQACYESYKYKSQK